MKVFKKKSVKTLCAYICDKCGREADFEKDGFEAQEFISIRQRALYASIFNDGDLICIELCQYCVKELLGPWIRLEEPENKEYW